MTLEQLGFTVHRLMARVLYGSATVGPLSHEVLLVDIEGDREGDRWIADVGFGANGLIAPSPCEPDMKRGSTRTIFA